MTDEVTTTGPQNTQPIARRLGLTRSDAVAYYQRGLKSFEAGDLENAILDLNEAIYLDQGYAEFYSTRGLFHIENDEADAARIDLEYALKVSKRQWLAHYGLGILAHNDGDYEAAVKHFTEATKIRADRAETWYYRAIAQHNLGDDAQAVSDMERAEQLFPPSDKRRKDASAWVKEFKKTSLSPIPQSKAPPLNPPPERPQLNAPGSSDSSRR
jgi:Flp pilus assembly protein TadD